MASPSMRNTSHNGGSGGGGGGGGGAPAVVKKEYISHAIAPEKESFATERKELLQEAVTDFVEHAKKQRISLTMYKAQNSHRSEKTGKLSGMRLDAPSNIIADSVIFTNDFPGVRAMYLIEGLDESQRSAYQDRVTKAIDKISDNPLFFDTSILYDHDYQESRAKTSKITFDPSYTSIGLYVMKQEISEIESRPALVLCIQLTNCTAELKKFVRELGHEDRRESSYFDNATSRFKGLEAVYTSVVYKDALAQAESNCNFIASYLHGIGSDAPRSAAPAAASPTDSSSSPLPPDTLEIKPTVVNHFNVIEMDKSMSQNCEYYDHCLSTKRISSGVLIGHGPSNGFWWFRGKNKTPLAINTAIKTARSVPMGTRRTARFLTGKSYSRKGNIVCWGSVSPNPYCDENLYEKLTYDSEFYLGLGPYTGFDYATTDVTPLKTLKVYISSPLQISPERNWQKVHMPLRHWLNYPVVENDLIVVVPLTHPFVSEHFFKVYAKYAHDNKLSFKEVVEGDSKMENGKKKIYQSIIFYKDPLLRLLRATKIYETLLNLC